MAAAQTSAKAAKPIAVITDAEPDDAVALWIIINSLEYDEMMILVTDSPDPSQKVDRMMELLPKRETTRVKVTVGAPSRKKHPWVLAPASGAEIPNSLEEFRSWLVANPDASLLAISPPRDLLALVKAEPKILAKRMVGYYGSFNSRTLADEAERQRPGAGAEKMAEIAAALESAESPYYFDTFNGFGPTGCSILTRTSDPEFFAAIPDDLRAFIASWNENIAEGSIQGLAEWFDIAVTGGAGSSGCGYRLDIPVTVEKATGEDNKGKWRRANGAQSQAFILGKDSGDTIDAHLKDAKYDGGALRYIAKDRQKLTAMALNGLDGQMVFADPVIAAAMTLTGTGGKYNKCEVKRAMTTDDWFNTIPSEEASADSKIIWISPHLAGKNVEAFRAELLGNIVKLLKRD